MKHPSPRNTPETPFAARLRAARKMAGLSMEELACKLGGVVTKQAISKYEQGLMMPSPEVLDKLDEVLKIRKGEPKAALKTRSLEAPEGPYSLIVMPAAATAAPEEAKAGPAGVRASITLRAMPRGPSHADHAEAIQSPSSRRARYLRDWDFAAAGIAPLEKIRFRAGERLASKTEAALKYRIADYLQKYLELEAILGQPAPFKNPLGLLAPRSREEVEAAAARVREAWELGRGPIVNLLGLLEDKGVKIYETRGIDFFEGLSGRYGEVVFVAVSMDRPADRVRFTAAHELGHLLCDFDAAESPEGECHAFGAAFLLPRPALEKAFTPARRKVTLGDLAEIKETYGVSLQAIMYRAHRLGFATDRQFRSFRKTLRDKDWLVTEPVAYEGKERAGRFRRLLHYAVAAAILDIGRAAELLGTTPEALKEEIGDIF
jgi:Zn-dependent peptidase ImmA (M78 family)/transcriptional regulator with XRE-family HTH domain